MARDDSVNRMLRRLEDYARYGVPPRSKGMGTPTVEETREVLGYLVELGWLLPGGRRILHAAPGQQDAADRMREELARLSDPDGFAAWQAADIAAEAARALDGDDDDAADSDLGMPGMPDTE